jgi:hypothetical protein
MRARGHRGPGWRTLALILVVGVAGLAVERGLHLSPGEHKLVLLGVIAGFYGVTGLWIAANRAALQDLDDAVHRQQRRDPSVYGTPRFPTRTQAHFSGTALFHRHD